MRNYAPGLEERFFFDRKAVVLACDLNASTLDIVDRVIGSSMPKGEFIGFCTHCKGEELVPEADAKERKVGEAWV